MVWLCQVGLKPTEIVSAIVGILGVAFGIFTFIYVRRSRIVVRLWAGTLDKEDGPPQDVLFLEATNMGERTVSIAEPAILMPKGVKVLVMTPKREFPVAVAAGGACRVWLADDYLRKVFHDNFSPGTPVELVGAFIDGEGRQLSSKRLTLNA